MARKETRESVTEHVAIRERKREPNWRTRAYFLGDVTNECGPRGWLFIGDVVYGDSGWPSLCGHPKGKRHVFDVHEAQRDTP